MSDLNDYLKTIDSIEDDEEFCHEEYSVVKQYCWEKRFELGENDISIINFLFTYIVLLNLTK